MGCSSDAVEVCVIAFGDKTELVCDFGPLSQAIKPTGSCTELGAGVALVLEQLERRRKLLSGLGVSYCRPWLILISDDDLSIALLSWDAGEEELCYESYDRGAGSVSV